LPGKPATARLFGVADIQISAGSDEDGGGDQPGRYPQDALTCLLPAFCRESIL
jgi:hypothetical protein